MDPVTGAIVALVIFAVSIPVSYVVVVFVSTVATAVIIDDDTDAGLTLGAFVGFLLASVYSTFALIQVVLQIVRLVQLASGTAV